MTLPLRPLDKINYDCFRKGGAQDKINKKKREYKREKHFKKINQFQNFLLTRDHASKNLNGI